MGSFFGSVPLNGNSADRIGREILQAAEMDTTNPVEGRASRFPRHNPPNPQGEVVNMSEKYLHIRITELLEEKKIFTVISAIYSKSRKRDIENNVLFLMDFPVLAVDFGTGDRSHGSEPVLPMTSVPCSKMERNNFPLTLPLTGMI